MEFAHYTAAAGQLDSVTVLTNPGTFVNNNVVKIQDIRIEQGTFNLDKNDNTY